MSTVGDLTLSQVARRTGRYRPVLVTVVVVLVALRLLPERDTTAPEASAAPAALVTDGAGVTPSSAPTSAPLDAASAPTTTVAAASTAVSRDAGVSGSPAPALPAPPAAAPSNEEPVPASTPTTAPTEAAAAVPRLVATAWASASAGTPLADAGVPDGSLPVGTRVGERDKFSFLRYDVAPGVVELAVDPDGSRGIGAPLVQACRVTTSGWDSGVAMDFDEAPQWDPSACVDGRADGDSWVFDVAGLDATEGIALVPPPDAPLDYQVAFRPPA